MPLAPSSSPLGKGGEEGRREGGEEEGGRGGGREGRRVESGSGEWK